MRAVRPTYSTDAIRLSLLRGARAEATLPAEHRIHTRNLTGTWESPIAVRLYPQDRETGFLLREMTTAKSFCGWPAHKQDHLIWRSSRRLTLVKANDIRAR